MGGLGSKLGCANNGLEVGTNGDLLTPRGTVAADEEIGLGDRISE